MEGELFILLVYQLKLICTAFLYRAIVFVVDSVAFQREMKDVAEFLYQLLTDNTILKNAPPLLIACNKQGKDYHLWNKPAFIYTYFKMFILISILPYLI